MPKAGRHTINIRVVRLPRPSSGARPSRPVPHAVTFSRRRINFDRSRSRKVTAAITVPQRLPQCRKDRSTAGMFSSCWCFLTASKKMLSSAVLRPFRTHSMMSQHN
ncbi:hypothetical protein AcV5_010333 [Taiwanofungus camphoratus]|nr:hypothetical protein AcV5_010333 [Antrodia cinnamomea]